MAMTPEELLKLVDAAAETKADAAAKTNPDDVAKTKADDAAKKKADDIAVAKKFIAATVIVSFLKAPLQLARAKELEFLGLYKQALYGNCHLPKPLLPGPDSAKWSAWKAVSNKRVTQQAAQLEYIEKGKAVVNEHSAQVKAIIANLEPKDIQDLIQLQTTILLGLQHLEKKTKSDIAMLLTDLPPNVTGTKKSKELKTLLTTLTDEYKKLVVTLQKKKKEEKKVVADVPKPTPPTPTNGTTAALPAPANTGGPAAAVPPGPMLLFAAKDELGKRLDTDRAANAVATGPAGATPAKVEDGSQNRAASITLT